MKVAATTSAMVVTAAVLLSGCGPSYRMLRDGDSRFEHCYALDERTDVDAQERAQCWERFADAKYPGQGVDRTRYAVGRVQALRSLSSRGTPNPGAPVAMNTQALSVHAQAPANAFVPPPNIVRLEPVSPPRMPANRERWRVGLRCLRPRVRRLRQRLCRSGRQGQRLWRVATRASRPNAARVAHRVGPKLTA
jgi:hypothetical protein